MIEVLREFHSIVGEIIKRVNIHVTYYRICVNREILEKKGVTSNDVWEREEGCNDFQIFFKNLQS